MVISALIDLLMNFVIHFLKTHVVPLRRSCSVNLNYCNNHTHPIYGENCTNRPINDHCFTCMTCGALKAYMTFEFGRTLYLSHAYFLTKLSWCAQKNP